MRRHLDETDRKALTLHCSFCKAEPGTSCRTTRTKAPSRYRTGAGYVTMIHVPRYRAAMGLLRIKKASKEQQ